MAGAVRAVGTRADERLPRMRLESHRVTDLYSVAHLFPPSAGRSGIYVLHFADGQRYVGQSTNVVARFSAHRRRYPDIVRLDFHRCPREELDRVELEQIRAQRRSGVQLRNITHSTGPVGDSDLDAVITPARQLAWISEGADLRDVARRADDPEQRARFAPKFERLSTDPMFGGVAVLLRTYVAMTLPRPKQTERTFWSLSCLPSTGRRRDWQRLAAVSVNKMETLVLGKATVDGEQLLGGFVNVDRAALLEYGGTLTGLRRRFPTLGFQRASYEAAGGQAVTVQGLAEDLLAVLQTEWLTDAARALNLMLLRKGPTLQWRWHCFDLADLALSDRALDRALRQATFARPHHPPAG